MLLEVLRETVIDSLKLLPFLFAAYLAIEFIEDRAEEKTVALVHRAGRWGPVLGAALGVIPQCGFSAATANLYAGGIITRGTLLAVFLSTSDEMLPILLSSSAPVSLILKLLGYKALAGILLGVTVDTVASKLGYERKKSIHEMCEQEHCHCEDGIFKSALRHTLKIFAFLFVVTFVLNLLVEAVGPETLGAFVLNRPVIGELLGGIIGAIGGVGAATIYNSRHRKEGIDISWSERAAQDFMLESLLLYLAVAHFGRGRGDWQEGESPEFWKKAVQDAMTEQKVSFQAIRKLTPEEGVEQLTRMTDSLLRGVFMQLYERSI